MKIIAIHLPQFHTVKENDEWWGEGFTEWINVKSANKLSKNHIQPREPLNDNYYNLLEKETMEWQAKISSDNGIYGFCYYHYWFNGRKILEKPVENLLKWKDIKQNFCFYWANHTWKKTWNGTHKILIEQTYGGEKEWEDHFNYLLPFFQDERYIKINNKPIFVLYSAEDISDCENRIKYFNNRIKEYGFDGVYFIETLKKLKGKKVNINSDGVMIREPSMAFDSMSVFNKLINRLKRKLKTPVTYSYDKVWKAIIRNYRMKKAPDVMPSIIIDWDNTSRHKNRGSFLKGVSVNKFKKYFSKFIKECKNENEFLFINAWNEWAEGMYLEPDKVNKYSFLEAIKEVLNENKIFIEDKLERDK